MFGFSSDLVARPGSRWQVLVITTRGIKNQGVEKLFGELNDSSAVPSVGTMYLGIRSKLYSGGACSDFDIRTIGRGEFRLVGAWMFFSGCVLGMLPGDS